MTEILISIIESIGVPLVLKLIAGSNEREYVMAILDAEYKTAEAAALAAAKAKFGK